MAALHSQRVNTIAGADLLSCDDGAAHGSAPAVTPHWIDAAAMLVGLTVGIFSVTLGVEAVNSATGTIDRYPPALLLFVVISMLYWLARVSFTKRYSHA
jgi:hypothetical protein